MEMIIENTKNWNESNTHLEFDHPHQFEKYFWETLTEGKTYNSFKTFNSTVNHIVNYEYGKFVFRFLKLNVLWVKICYDLFKSSKDNLDFMIKFALTATLNHAYQVSEITGVSIDESIRRLRIARNIPIKDKTTKQRKTSRQARYPLIGSEVCPFTNYVKAFDDAKPKLKLNYSIMVIEKSCILDVEKYECDKHESCVLFKDLRGNIKHLDECEFWTDDQYWIKKYPTEIDMNIE